MPKNDKAREKKVNVAVKALVRFPGMRVREAMHFARFSKKEIDNVNVRRIVSRRQFSVVRRCTSLAVRGRRCSLVVAPAVVVVVLLS